MLGDVRRQNVLQQNLRSKWKWDGIRIGREKAEHEILISNFFFN